MIKHVKEIKPLSIFYHYMLILVMHHTLHIISFHNFIFINNHPMLILVVQVVYSLISLSFQLTHSYQILLWFLNTRSVHLRSMSWWTYGSSTLYKKQVAIDLGEYRKTPGIRYQFYSIWEGQTVGKTLWMNQIDQKH